VPITFFQNGLFFRNGPFRPAAMAEAQTFVNDLRDGVCSWLCFSSQPNRVRSRVCVWRACWPGFLPAELRGEFPDGVVIATTDRSSTAYECAPFPRARDPSLSGSLRSFGRPSMGNPHTASSVGSGLATAAVGRRAAPLVA
jgi:hypothetical protein